MAPTDKTRTILIIDDDAEMASFLARFLEKYNYRLVHAGRPELGLKELERVKPDAVLLDVSLPGISGLEVCKEIRKKSAVPILMISALGEIPDRVVGLEIGADDYLPKPFSPRELVARLEAVLRRSGRADTQSASDALISHGPLEIDKGRRTVTIDGEPVEISASEFELLLLFIAKPGHVFSRDDLMNGLRGIDWDAYNRSVDVLVSRLRRKLKDNAKQPRFLKTVWGTGYTFLPEPAKRKAS